MKTFKELLIELDACEKAVEWAEDKLIEEVVETCHRGDWLLWLAQKLDIGLKPLTLAKGHCANTVRHLMDDKRSLKAVDMAIAFGEGKATIRELDNTAAGAWAADTSVVAAHAAWTASARASFATATRAAYAYWAAAWDSEASDARAKNEMQTADICRKYIGDLIIEKVNEICKPKVYPKEKK